jgi:hypothetical protein
MSETTRSNARIHPAIDFTQDHAYIGQLMPCGGLDSNPSLLHLIRDDGELILAEEASLSDYEVELLFRDFYVESRWSIDAIFRFNHRQEAIEPDQLLQAVRETFTTYIELPDSRFYDFLALWCIGTYFFSLFNTYPYVYVGGIMESGKTKLLSVCQGICFNAIFSGNMSTAVVYRLIQNGRSSLFIDETERLSTRYRAFEFRNILLSGYRKGVRTYRNRQTADGNWVPEAFEVYGPKMLANIEGLEDVLESRCISIVMRRGLNAEVTNREVDVTSSEWQELRDLIYPFLLTNWQQVRAIYNALDNTTELRNREWELWKPILALARYFDGEDSTALYEEMVALASDMAEERRRSNYTSPECVIVEVLCSIVTRDGWYSLGDIKQVVLDRFPDWEHWLSERYIGRVLRRLGFSSDRRVGPGYEYFLRASEVQECARRLGISVVGELSEPSEHTGEQGTEDHNES